MDSDILKKDRAGGSLVFGAVRVNLYCVKIYHGDGVEGKFENVVLT